MIDIPGAARAAIVWSECNATRKAFVKRQTKLFIASKNPLTRRTVDIECKLLQPGTHKISPGRLYTKRTIRGGLVLATAAAAPFPAGSP